jgi:hypothetical protein
MDFFKNACRLHTKFLVSRLLISSAYGGWMSAEKSQRHMQLCRFYVAAVRGMDDTEQVMVGCEDFKFVKDQTLNLTDNLNESIGFPLDYPPDYEKFEPLFFEKFHLLALKALKI